MARRPTKPTPTQKKLRLEVTDVNLVANSVLMEGYLDKFKYILMVDGDLDADFVVNAVVGDKYDLTFKNAIKLDPKAVKKTTSKKGSTSATQMTGVMKGTTCPGSGIEVKKNETYAVRVKGYYGGNHSVTKIDCQHCGKTIAVNGGYGGKPLTVRKHNA